AVASLTISDYVRGRGYGDDLFNLHLLPMCGVLWHASPASMWSFPAGVLLRLLRDQGLLGLRPAGSWRTVDGGARALIDRLIAPFRGSIQLNRRVVRIIRNGPGRGVTVMTAEGAVHAFDRVIV